MYADLRVKCLTRFCASCRATISPKLQRLARNCLYVTKYYQDQFQCDPSEKLQRAYREGKYHVYGLECECTYFNIELGKISSEKGSITFLYWL